MCNIPTFTLHLFFFSTILAEFCWILYLKKKEENIWTASHHEINASHLRFPETWCTHSCPLTQSLQTLCWLIWQALNATSGILHRIVSSIYSKRLHTYHCHIFIRNECTLVKTQTRDWYKMFSIYICSVIQNNKVYTCNVYLNKLKRYLQN